MIILCESAEQAAAAPGTGDILALTPEVAWYCQQHARSYRKLEEFYCERNVAFEHRVMFEAELAWIDFTDDFLAQAMPEYKNVKFRPALATSFLLQNLFDEFFFAAHAVSRLCEQTEGPILYWPSARQHVPNHLHPNQSVIPSILPMIAGSRATACDAVARRTAAADPSPRSFRNTLRRYLGNRGTGEMRQLRHAGLGRYLTSRFGASGMRESILVLEGGYDLEPLILALRGSGMAIDWLTNLMPSTEPEPHDAQLAGAFRSIARQRAFWAPLEHCGLTRNPLAEASLSHWWHQIIPQYWRAFQRAQQTLDSQRYSAVLTWEAGGGTLIAPMLQAAQYSQVPVVLYQHGSSARTSGTWWFSWLAHAGTLLVYGSGTERQLRRTWPPPPHARAALKPVGSARLDALQASMTPARIADVRRRLSAGDPRPIVLYVPTYFGGYGRATSDAAGYPEIAYFETQQRVLRVFAEFPGVRLLYKDLRTVNSLANPIPEFLAKSVPNAGLMPSSVRLAEAVFAADMIIVDHVITALGEALLTSKPIIVYDPGSLDAIPEAPEARGFLRKRVQLAETADEFENVVRSFLIAGDFSEVVNPDDSFQREFSTRGASIEAAAAEIDRLVSPETQFALAVAPDR